MSNNATLVLTRSRFWLRFGDQESMTVEFKQQLQRASRLQEPMVAFANTRGGSILVGISDRRPRQILGVAWGQDLIEQVQEAARSTQPPLQVEVESPGTLAGYGTVENLREAQYSRNERIMDGLQRLGLVEEAGQGIDRMIAEMEDALLDPPEFEERSASFVVRLRGGSVFAAEDRLWVSQFGPLELDADAKVALVFARRTGAITNEQLRRLRPLDREASRETLQDLVAHGLLETFGRGRGTGYRLSALAMEARSTATLGEQLVAVLNHARRTGVVVNAEVRGLLGVGAPEAHTILEAEDEA